MGGRFTAGARRMLTGKHARVGYRGLGLGFAALGRPPPLDFGEWRVVVGEHDGDAVAEVLYKG